jgi:hypothetical protein
MTIKLYPPSKMVHPTSTTKITFSKSPEKKILRSWQDYKADIIAIITRIEALGSTIDHQWLHTYCLELIMQHRKDLPGLKAFMDNLEIEMRLFFSD